MMYAVRVTLTVALVASSVVALPNHLKAVVVDTDPIPIVKEKGVSASFGGYSAQAGLGSSGLFAAADSPHGSASAGLGDSAAGGLGASASTGGSDVSVGTGGHVKPGVGHGVHKPGPLGPGLFDNIFNIPISVLQAVNTYLNNRGPVTKPIHRRRGHHPAVVYKTVTPEQAGGESEQTLGKTHSEAEAAVHPPTGQATGHAPVVLQKRVNYDEIFNIPIAALKSVNQLLNNGKK